jgi:two-component system sensor histidine kinase KdpD
MENGQVRNAGAKEREKIPVETAISSINDRVSTRERIREILFSAAMLGLCSVICWWFKLLNGVESNIVVLYIFFVFLISVRTANWIYSVCAAGLSVVIYNFLFTAPEFTLHAYDNRYTVSFGVMLLIALLTGVMAARLRTQARNSARMAFRVSVLYETNQLVEKCRSQDEIKEITAKQLVRLLHRNVLLYRDRGSVDGKPAMFLSDNSREPGFAAEQEKAAAELAFEHGEKTGRGTDSVPEASCVYLTIRLNQTVCGVMGIDVREDELDIF